jgi:hypothetical protein
LHKSLNSKFIFKPNLEMKQIGRNDKKKKNKRVLGPTAPTFGPTARNRLRGPTPTLPHARAGHSLKRGPARQPGCLALCFLPHGLHVGPLVQLALLPQQKSRFLLRARGIRGRLTRSGLDNRPPSGGDKSLRSSLTFNP